MNALTMPPVTVKQRLEDRSWGTRFVYDVACASCGHLAAFDAAAWADTNAVREGCERQARAAAKTFADSHACPTGPAPLLLVQLDARSAAYLLFAADVDPDTLNDDQARDAIRNEFAREHCDLSVALRTVAGEYGDHPETAAHHMNACVIRASRLCGVTP